jgi:hypothetical protein
VGVKPNEPIQIPFDASLKFDFQGSRVTSVGGLLLVGELDERLGLEKLISELLSDSRQGLNKQFTRADLGAAGAERISLRLWSLNLGPREERWSGVWKIDYTAASGTRQTAKMSCRSPADLAGTCSGGKLVVSRTGDAYDARVRGRNRKLRVECALRQFVAGEGGN